ncbi:MAG: hypothetical protein V1865_02120 [bacterium]
MENIELVSHATIRVDYSLGMDQIINDFVESPEKKAEIIKYYPVKTPQSGELEVEIDIFEIKQEFIGYNITKELKRKFYRPAYFNEAYALIKKYPGMLDFYKEIIPLGTRYQFPNGVDVLTIKNHGVSLHTGIFWYGSVIKPNPEPTKKENYSFKEEAKERICFPAVKINRFEPESSLSHHRCPFYDFYLLGQDLNLYLIENPRYVEKLGSCALLSQITRMVACKMEEKKEVPDYEKCCLIGQPHLAEKICSIKDCASVCSRAISNEDFQYIPFYMWNDYVMGKNTPRPQIMQRKTCD